METMRYPRTLALLALGALATLNACNEAPEQAKNNGSGDISVSAIAPTSDEVAKSLSVEVKPGEGGYDVTLQAGAETPASPELYVQLSYDPKTGHAHGLDSAVAGSSGGAQAWIGMLMEPSPGLIDAGFAATGQDEAHFIQPGDILAKFKILDGAAPKGASSSDTSHANTVRARNLTLTQNSEGNWVLTWDYTNPGDCNQDGEVGISDLQPIAAHYLEKVEDDYSDPLRHVDGDHNGEINAGDLTPMSSNYQNEIWAYQIEMSEDGQNGFIMVGQLILGEQEREGPGDTVQFSYTFGAQYVDGYYYRVVPLNAGMHFGAPSEAVSSAGRLLVIDDVQPGREFLITIGVKGLTGNLTHCNGVRVVYPNSYEYVANSFNAGSPGGGPGDVDGIWTSFATQLLVPPEMLLRENAIGNEKAFDMNVSVTAHSLDHSPVGFGDMMNFRLKAKSTDPLVLSFQTESDGIKRTYYSDVNQLEQWFGPAIGFTIK